MNKKYILVFIFILTTLFLTFFLIRPNLTKNVIGTTKNASYGLNSAGNGFSRFFGSFGQMSSLRKQNEELYQKIILLEVDRSKIIELEHENKLLKQELGFSESNQELSLLPATIIGREPTTFLDYIIVDKGEKEGVKKGMGAIFSGSLVGQVSEVYPNQSKLILITSKNSIIQAMLQGSRSKGLLKGGISGLMLENIVQDVTLTKGEYVVTSGLDGQLKPGILIGKTTGIESSSSDLFKNIDVEPIADLARLELVFIIQ